MLQLLYTGMLETTKIRREGYAIRPTFDEFLER
jgi:myosin heavy subunit